MNQKVIFYIQSFKGSGLGHLKRSLNLAKKFKSSGYLVSFCGEISPEARQVIKNENISLSSKEESGEIVIIDATSIDPNLLNKIKRYKYRFLISPVFDDYDLPSHIFTRMQPDKEIKLILEKQEIIYDPNFSFSTTNNLKFKENIKCENIKVGICISGSSTYIDLDGLLHECTKNENVCSITAFVDNIEEKYFLNQKICYKQKDVEELWDTFHDIDCLITGDGLMIFEAMAQGIPVISLYRNGAWKKNSFFYEKNLCFAFSIERLNYSDINDILSNKDQLQIMRKNLIDKQYWLKQDFLFETILKKLENLGI